MEFLIEECIDDQNSNVGQLFQRRFRVPYSIFTYILQIIEEEGWHNQAEFDRAGLQTSRLDLKVLGWLRALGRGNTEHHYIYYSIIEPIF